MARSLICVVCGEPCLPKYQNVFWAWTVHGKRLERWARHVNCKGGKL